MKSKLLLLICILMSQLSDAAPAFPLKISENNRYLVDFSRKPFFVVGDTPWSLIAQLNADEIIEYLDDRQRRGFNAIIVNLIEHKFASKAPAKIDGIQPFLAPGDFTQPNPAYFNYAHRAIEAAGKRGISVWLCPAYLGWGGGNEGFFKEIKKAGPQVLRGYGRFLGERFKETMNIVWMPGGDYAMPENERWAGQEVALGIRDGGARQIMTAHGGQTSAVTTFGDQSWLAVDSVYRYQADLWLPLQTNWIRQPVRPYVMIESAYEGEHKASPARIRAQAWWSVTCGACGQFFGNNPIWYFDGPGFTDRKSAPTWREALDLAGSRDMGRMARILGIYPWHELVPDVEGKLIAAGAGEGGNRVTAARTANERFAMLYIPSDGETPREFKLNLAGFPGPLKALWINPAKDEAQRQNIIAIENKNNVKFSTPGHNGAGANDWVLALEIQ